MVTVELASAVPVNGGLLLFVGLEPLARAIVGAVGGVVSIVRLRGELVGLTLPAASVAVAVMAWVPSAIALVGVKVQFPEASAVVVPI